MLHYFIYCLTLTFNLQNVSMKFISMFLQKKFLVEQVQSLVEKKNTFSFKACDL